MNNKPETIESVRLQAGYIIGQLLSCVERAEEDKWIGGGPLTVEAIKHWQSWQKKNTEVKLPATHEAQLLLEKAIATGNKIFSKEDKVWTRDDTLAALQMSNLLNKALDRLRPRML